VNHAELLAKLDEFAAAPDRDDWWMPHEVIEEAAAAIRELVDKLDDLAEIARDE
jgi:predicted transcriptional regulator